MLFCGTAAEHYASMTTDRAGKAGIGCVIGRTEEHLGEERAGALIGQILLQAWVQGTVPRLPRRLLEPAGRRGVEIHNEDVR